MERKFDDGSRCIHFPNGTVKTIQPSGLVEVVFPNGDKKERYTDQRVLYYYASVDTTHVTYPDGLQALNTHAQAT